MMSDLDLPLPALRAQLASAVNLIVQVSRLQDGSRKVTHVSEVRGYDAASGNYEIVDLFLREYQGFDSRGSVASEIVPTGMLPSTLSQLHEHGVDLPAAVHAAAKRSSLPPPRRRS